MTQFTRFGIERDRENSALLTDSRPGKNTQLPLADLFRQSQPHRGNEDVNDAGQLALFEAF